MVAEAGGAHLDLARSIVTPLALVSAAVTPVPGLLFDRGEADQSLVSLQSAAELVHVKRVEVAGWRWCPALRLLVAGHRDPDFVALGAKERNT